MGRNTSIPWCHHTFNAWWGCTKISPGCKYCYAETWSRRVGHGKSKLPIWGADAERLFFGDKHWREPLGWNDGAPTLLGEPRPRVFVNSMADTFEGRRDLDPWRARLWALIDRCQALTWMLLTKRPDNCLAMLPPAWLERWPAHVWIGATAEDQEQLEIRAPELQKLKQAVAPGGRLITFFSCEPLLGRLDVEAFLPGYRKRPVTDPHLDAPNGSIVGGWKRVGDWWWPADHQSVDWVIAGGESASPRRMELEHASDLLEQCGDAGVPYFFKQTGSIVARELGLLHPKGEDLEELPASLAHLRVREFPT